MRGGWLWLIVAAGGWLVYCAAAFGFPDSELGASYVMQGASVLCGVALLLTVMLAGERAALRPALRWALAGGGAGLMLAPYVFNLHAPGWRALSTLGLLAVALAVGYWIGDRMEKVTNLVPLAVAMSLADIYSVALGPSREVGEKLLAHYSEVQARIASLGAGASAEQAARAAATMRAPLVESVVAQVPLAGLHTTVPVLGIGDFIALGFLFRAVWLHRLGAGGVFTAALLACVTALATSLLTGRIMPALPFITLGVVGWLLLTSPRLRRLDRQEQWLTVAVIGLFGALMLGKWLVGLLPGR